MSSSSNRTGLPISLVPLSSLCTGYTPRSLPLLSREKPRHESKCWVCWITRHVLSITFSVEKTGCPDDGVITSSAKLTRIWGLKILVRDTWAVVYGWLIYGDSLLIIAFLQIVPSSSFSQIKTSASFHVWEASEQRLGSTGKSTVSREFEGSFCFEAADFNLMRCSSCRLALCEKWQSELNESLSSW